MLGWEFPPFFAGGLGVVCYELTKALSKFDDLEITYLMPYGSRDMKSHINLLAAKSLIPKIEIIEIDSFFKAYMSEEEYSKEYKKLVAQDEEYSDPKKLYGANLYAEVERFAKRALEIAKTLDFDVIHAHDWAVYPAGVRISKQFNKPLIVHIHNTVYDRYLKGGGHEYDIECYGFNNSHRIIAISNYI